MTTKSSRNHLKKKYKAKSISQNVEPQTEQKELTMLSTLTKCYNSGILSAFVDSPGSQMGKAIAWGEVDIVL